MNLATEISIDALIKIGLLPLILIYSALPENIFASLGPNCIWQTLFDFECWGCGLTRAIREGLRLHWSNSWSLNPAAPLVLLLVGYLFFNEVFRLIKRKK